MGIEAIGTGLKTLLETISDIKSVFAPNELPESINELPSALIIPGETEYDKTFGGAIDCHFRIIILLAKQDQPTALNRMLDYANPTGTDSVRAAINADNTLDGSCDSSQLISNSGAGFTVWGGHLYLSTEFELIAYA